VKVNGEKDFRKRGKRRRDGSHVLYLHEAHKAIENQRQSAQVKAELSESAKKKKGGEKRKFPAHGQRGKISHSKRPDVGRIAQEV